MQIVITALENQTLQTKKKVNDCIHQKQMQEY
jgi:hypothetical protein